MTMAKNLGLALTFLAAAAATTSDHVCPDVERLHHPVLCHYLQRLQDDSELLAEDLRFEAQKLGLLVDLRGSSTTITRQERYLSEQADLQLPVVFAHGMGDSCFNSGMQHIIKHTSELLGGVYTVCIPVGKTRSEDTNNGYFLNMDASVDAFAAAIQEDQQLQNGFHAIGFSQGNNVIRGYIERYNSDPFVVNRFISINGVNAGEGAVPYCKPSSLRSSNVNNAMCDLLMEQASNRAYTHWAQQHSFQANYWRDPRRKAAQKYYEYSQLAIWNQEGPHYGSNATLKENYLKTQQFVWVWATKDGMVWPSQGEQWGAPNPDDPFAEDGILPMKQTDWYIHDNFGLRTAEEEGRNFYEEFEGDHLQFEMEDFDRWVLSYLVGGIMYTE